MATAARLLLLLFLTAAASAWEMNIRLPTEMLNGGEAVVAPIIHALRPLLGSGGQLAARAGVACDSWRLGVEAHNVIGWKTVPARCEGYVGHYMLGGHYRRDSAVVVDEAIAYAESLQLAGNGKEIWVFDIDETSLSNLPYYAKHGFGATLYNDTSFREYVAEGSAPALPETRRLYRRLLQLGVKPVFLTGRTEDQRNITITNLRRQGYSGWMKLLLKPAVHAAGELQGSAVAYKSGERQKLEDAGFAIVGNIGDQWSDILGTPEGARTFKLPDPMYYIG
ncbi:acid phosphatase 1-like [Oryza glaberrima]|uniref:Acid phosphatase n=2 Tax=Oryza TaxID=4527 RepID=A0A0D3G458_9ORYZ|nr:acid phosphatase 1-like [Oryza glaberrima]